MLTLVIDSATEACSVALFDGSRLVSGTFEMLGRGHAERLVPMISALPDKGRASCIAVSLGPGSFTGVRVGIAAARALAFAWDAELCGFPTLGLVAAMARAQKGAQPVGVAMTGGHGEWFVQGYDANGAASRETSSLIPEAATAATGELLVAGSEAEALVARRASGQAFKVWPDARSFQDLPHHLIVADVRPLYGRAPDAKVPKPAS